MQGGEAAVTGSSGRSAQGQGGTEDQGLGAEGEGHPMKPRNAQISGHEAQSSPSVCPCPKEQIPSRLGGRASSVSQSKDASHSRVGPHIPGCCALTPSRRAAAARPLFLCVQGPLWQSGPACHRAEGAAQSPVPLVKGGLRARPRFRPHGQYLLPATWPERTPLGLPWGLCQGTSPGSLQAPERSPTAVLIGNVGSAPLRPQSLSERKIHDEQ